MDRSIHGIGPGKVLVNYGPVCLSAQAWRAGAPDEEAALAGARQAASALDRLSKWLETARLPVSHPDCLVRAEQPDILKRMISAVKALDQGDFTPMAAVAGAFSESTAAACQQAGADRVIVNNGGDIALITGPGQKAFKVGLVQTPDTGEAGHILTIHPADGIGGVATSGLGGRSLTKGVASAVTCWGRFCPETDAAATSIANAATVEDPAVVLKPAEEIDPMTDLRGHRVVASVGKLEKQAVDQALAAGRERAETLIRQGLIKGCLIFVQGRKEMITPPEIEQSDKK